MSWPQQQAPGALGSFNIKSPGIRSGKILLPNDQYERLPPPIQDVFERVATKSGFMWRYMFAEEPYVPAPYAVERKEDGDVLDEWDYLTKTLHDAIGDAVSQVHNVSLVDLDEDEEYVYGIFCAVLTLFGYSESDWLLQHEFGAMYSIRWIDGLDLTDNE